MTQTLIPWQVAKSKIGEYTTSKWKHKWTTSPHYKHTKLGAHRLINLEIPVLVRSLKSSNVELC